MLESSNACLKSENTNLSFTEAPVVLPDGLPTATSELDPSGVPDVSTSVSSIPLTEGDQAVSPPLDVETSNADSYPSDTRDESAQSPSSTPSVDLDAMKMMKPRSRWRPKLKLRVPNQQSKSPSTEYKPVPRGTFLDTPEVGPFFKNLEVSQCPVYGTGADTPLADPSYSYLSHLWAVSPLVARSRFGSADPLEQASNVLRLNLTNANNGHLTNLPVPKTPTGGLDTPVVDLPLLVNPESGFLVPAYQSSPIANGNSNSTSAAKTT